MMRKQIAIFFILLANIILLAHGIVPHHHHHQNMVCVNSRHCQSNSDQHEHTTSTHDHHHDGESDAQVCVLKQAVFIPSNQWNQNDNCLYGSHKTLSLSDIQGITTSNGFKAIVPRIALTTQIEFNPDTYFNFVSNSLGLRAPPVV